MVRNSRIEFVVTKEEKDKIKKRADENGLSIGSYCKQLALKAEVEIKCKALSIKLRNSYVNSF